MCEIEQQVTVRPSCSVEIALVQFVASLRIHLSDGVGKQILITHVLQHDQVLGIKRYVPAEASVVKQVLLNEYYIDVPVMTALGEEFAHVPRADLVQQLVQHDESLFVTHIFEVGDACVVDYPSGTCQLLTRCGSVLSEAPHDVAEIGHCAQSD